ncbi:hypothetical protein V8E53_001049 [Lactarius tabidus]
MRCVHPFASPLAPIFVFALSLALSLAHEANTIHVWFNFRTCANLQSSVQVRGSTYSLPTARPVLALSGSARNRTEPNLRARGIDLRRDTELSSSLVCMPGLV